MSKVQTEFSKDDKKAAKLAATMPSLATLKVVSLDMHRTDMRFSEEEGSRFIYGTSLEFDLHVTVGDGPPFVLRVPKETALRFLEPVVRVERDRQIARMQDEMRAFSAAEVVVDSEPLK